MMLSHETILWPNLKVLIIFNAFNISNKIPQLFFFPHECFYLDYQTFSDLIKGAAEEQWNQI